MTQSIYEDEKSVVKECFVKLKTINNKVLYPKSYAKVINRLGLMLEYDLMIFQKSVECTRVENEVVAISISPSSLRNQIFLAKAKELLGDNSKRTNKVMLILSESEYYAHTERYNSILKSLRNLGILIAIDRLGTLNTSFLYLRDLEIDVVRFDPLYTKELKSPQYKSIIEGFNVIAHNRGVKTWLRMIEDEDTKVMAQELQVDYLQGKHIAPLEKIYEN